MDGGAKKWRVKKYKRDIMLWNFESHYRSRFDGTVHTTKKYNASYSKMQFTFCIIAITVGEERIWLAKYCVDTKLK